MGSPPSRRTPFVRIAVASFVALSLTTAVACGDDTAPAASDSGEGPSTTDESGPDEPGGERVVEHRHGTTTVPADPLRVVTIGFTDQDYVLALGVVPVGVRDWFGDQPNAVWPWGQELLGDAEPLALERELNYEAIAALDPDVIIAVYAGLTDEEYELLDAIAPTVTQPPDVADYEISWQEQTLHTGAILGREEEAAALVADLTAKVDRARADHPEFEGADYAFASAVDGEHVLYGPTAAASTFLVSLGFEVPADIVELTSNDNHSFLFSEERMDVVDRSLTLWSEGEDTEGIQALLASPVYTDLAVHREGRDLFLGIDLYGGAFSFSSVLSLDLLVDDLVPAMAAAIDGDPATEPAL